MNLNKKKIFILKYKNLDIGKLVFFDDVWSFAYSDNFKEQSEINPIIDFPDVNKIYKWDKLNPFFSIRIPSLKQPYIRELIKNEEIDPTNEVDLLKRFGYKSIANPFLLIYLE